MAHLMRRPASVGPDGPLGRDSAPGDHEVDGRDSGDRLRDRHQGLLTWLPAFALLSILTVAWSFSVPLASAPDEAVHIVKAAAVVRGEWLGVQVPGDDFARMKVYVPSTFRNTLANFSCYRFRSWQAASCARKIKARPKLVAARIRVGRYPPLYYLLVGWPTLLSTSEATIRWMRVVSALLNSAVLATAFALIRRFRLGRGLTAGLCCALTPVLLYMASTVQPNGLEASLGVLLWTSLVGLSIWGRRAASGAGPPTMLVSAAGASASGLVLVRGLSPLWLVGILAVTFVLTPLERWREWLRSSIVRVWTVVVVIASALASAWIIGAHALNTQPWTVNPYRNDSRLTDFQLVIERSGWFVMQMESAVTDDAKVPTIDYIVAFSLLGLLIVAGLWAGRARERIALTLVGLCTWLAPVVLAAPRIPEYGITWQGRYALPFAVGIPLLAGTALLDSPRAVPFGPPRAGAVARVLRRARPIAMVLVALAWLQVGVTYWCDLRRYTVGTSGTLDLFDKWNPLWSPVLPLPVLAAGVPLLLLVLTVWCVHLMRRSEQPVTHATIDEWKMTTSSRS
ncbi:MAG: DUF2142 domain-containing protein [Acidimicrobiales bacterium]|jgi:hypothetical protein